ncbi:MAG: hypothetical protein U0670_02765 [Anaerolineae bacterium]
MQNDSQQAWIAQIKARGWARTVELFLDVIEPLGALGAQVLRVAQPALGIFGLHPMIGWLADAVETPEGLAALRSALEESQDEERGRDDSHPHDINTGDRTGSGGDLHAVRPPETRVVPAAGDPGVPVHPPAGRRSD